MEGTNPVLDRLQAAWVLAEQKLKDIRCPAPTDLVIGQANDGDDVLSFRKHAGTWRIVLLFDDQWRPVSDCPVVIRVELIKHFAALEAAVKENFEKQMKLIDEATEAFEQQLIQS